MSLLYLNYLLATCIITKQRSVYPFFGKNSFKLVATKKIKWHTFIMKVIERIDSKDNTDENKKLVTFNRKELEPILKIYGQMVASGHSRDYSISSSLTKTIFAIYRHSKETPLYMITKTPKLSKKFGVYSVISMNGEILRQGKDLRLVLQILNKKLLKIVQNNLYL